MRRDTGAPRGRGRGRSGFRVVFAALVLVPGGSLAAQDDAGFCFRPAPLPECRWQPVLEMKAGPVLGAGRYTVLRPGGVRESRPFAPETEVAWRLGVLVNLTPAWGLGATLDVSSWRGDTGLAGADLRVRRWLGAGWTVDLEGRVARQDDGVLLGESVLSTGLGVGASWRDLVGVWLRTDLIHLPGGVRSLGLGDLRYEQGTVPVVVGGASLGREAGLAATAALMGWVLLYLMAAGDAT